MKLYGKLYEVVWQVVLRGFSDMRRTSRSILGPLLFILCTVEVISIINRLGPLAHFNADDSQLYLGVPAAAAEQNAINCFVAGTTDVDRWLRAVAA